MVQIQQDGMCAFIDDMLARFTIQLQSPADVADERSEPMSPFDALVGELVRVRRLAAIQGRQHGVSLFDDPRDPLSQPSLAVGRIRDCGQIGDAESGRTGRLVRVGRSDAALGGTDGVGGAGFFACRVGRLVVRHDDVRLVADPQVCRRDLDAAGVDAVDLADEHVRVDHDAVGQVIHDARAKDADGQEVRGEAFAADLDRVPGIGTAAIADDDVGGFGQHVDDLALALVAPLQADDAAVAFEQVGISVRTVHAAP